MTEPELIRRQRESLRELIRRAADRAAAEQNAELGYSSQRTATEKELAQKLQELRARLDAETAAAQQEHQETRQRIAAAFESAHAACKKDYKATKHRITAQFLADTDTVKRELQEARWETAAVYEAAKNTAQQQLAIVKQQIDSAIEKLANTQQDATLYLEECRQEVPQVAAVSVVRTGEPGGKSTEELLDKLKKCVGAAESYLSQLRALRLPRLFVGKRIRWTFILIWLVSLAPVIWLAQPPGAGIPHRNLARVLAVAGSAAVVAIIGVATRFVLATVVRPRVARLYHPLCLAKADGEAISNRCHDAARIRLRQQQLEATQRRDAELRKAEEHCKRQLAVLAERREAAVRATEEKFPRRFAEIKESQDRDLGEADTRYPRLKGEIQERFDRDSREITAQYQARLNELNGAYERSWGSLVTSWRQAVEQLHATGAVVNAESRRRFPPWTEPSWDQWTPPVTIPPVIRCGEFRVNMDEIPYGSPTDSRLATDKPPSFTMPALVPFPAGCSMLFKAHDAGRERAVQAIQSVMLRLLTAVPPGKVKFTIIDPVGLGENFAAFMHLADYDESLVTSRIWTEPQHIERRLADMTEHMENVIQKYLRNEFETIEDYNAEAGEVAEPFRFLVVANFPVNFTESTARRLVSIASSGARCGVYVLVTADTKQPMPHGFNLADLERHAAHFDYVDASFVWRDRDFERFALTLDVPPAAEFVTRMLHVVGAKAKEASRVEVPFDFVAPPPDRWWTSDSRPGIDVPLGRAGATKLQHLRLGHGTAQHVLIAGKTGSGKSTLLHALITNLALHYSPEQVELYLVDFKKGVEFKDYARYELPHARVVAIESEREFGLSVLQRLDAELKRRGDLFRDRGVQDLIGFRDANGSERLPRILLIVDEFQEFFVEDDKIGQEAALLLDRLVRQGRAFGMHVHLGSQTLGGAYSLARSTMSQMAVRIALQCSETDAHLILSDENTAARLLSRPGEAIYNDANGLVEGNNFFQIVWLPDDRREDYLRRLRELAERRKLAPPAPQIVFEGNTPSDVRRNHLLRDAIEAAQWPAGRHVPRVWLGEAVAIKDPTAAVFRPQTGSNLLMVGQQDESALAMFASSLVSLAAAHAPGGSDAQPGAARFYVLDGSPHDSPHSGFLDRLVRLLPHPVKVGGPRELPEIMGEVAEELERRQQLTEPDPTVIYLFVYDLGRLRALRRDEDDFSFSRRTEEAPSPAKQFAGVLRDGAPLGMHTLVWCDSLNNLSRTLDRQSQREFELRVLFQMSVNDSSTLIDSPIAAKLGPFRALFFHEEQGQTEKFRPYGMPTPEWLASVSGQLRGRQSISRSAVPSHA